MSEKIGEEVRSKFLLGKTVHDEINKSFDQVIGHTVLTVAEAIDNCPRCITKTYTDGKRGVIKFKLMVIFHFGGH